LLWESLQQNLDDVLDIHTDWDSASHWTAWHADAPYVVFGGSSEEMAVSRLLASD
jgi:hypothetical protein